MASPETKSAFLFLYFELFFSSIYFHNNKRLILNFILLDLSRGMLKVTKALFIMNLILQLRMLKRDSLWFSKNGTVS